MGTAIDALLDKYNITAPEDETGGDEVEPVSAPEPTEDSSEIDAFMARINKNAGKTVIDLNNPIVGADQTPFVPGTTRRATDVTAPIEAAKDADKTRDYEYFYGKKPETLSTTTKISAVVGDVSNFLTDNVAQSPFQEERDAYAIKMEEFNKNALEVYENADEITIKQAKVLGIELPQWVTDPGKFEATAGGEKLPDQYPTTLKIALGALDDDRTVRVSYRLNMDEDGVLVKEAVLVPPPDSTAFSRIFTQAASTIIQETLGLVERDEDGKLDLKYVEDSDLALGIPDLEQGFAAGLVSDILAIGAPSVASLSAGKKVGKLVNAARLPKTAAVTTYGGGLIASTLTEGVMTKEGQEGLIFSADDVGLLTNSTDKEFNADVAIILDGLVFNGGFDGLLTVAGRGLSWFGSKTPGIKGLVDPEYVRSESGRRAIINVVTAIDPNLVGADSRTLAEGLRNLSLILGDNAVQTIRVGQTVKDIPVDTVNAIRTGARDYLEVTHRNIKRGMSDADWQKFLDEESMAMLERTVTLVRASEANTVLRSSQSRLTNEFGEVITEEADRIQQGDFVLTDATDALVDQSQTSVAAAKAVVEAQTAASSAFGKQLETVVSDDPFIAKLLQDTDALKFFDESPYIDQFVKLFGEDFLKVYKKTFDEVNLKYEAIPNVPVDIAALKQQLDNVFEVSGENTPRVLKVLQDTFQPKRTGGEFKIGAMDDPQAAQMKSLFQTPDEVLAGLEGQIGFKDLYKLKQNLAKLISETDDSAVRQRLMDLRNSITSTEPGGQMRFVIDQGKASDDTVLQEAANLAKAADDNYILSQSKYNSMTGKQLTDLAVLPAYKGANTPVPPGGQIRGMPDLKTQAVNNLGPAMMSDKTGAQFDNFVFAMDSMFSRDEISKPFLDMFTAKATDDLAKALASGDTQSAATIMRSFETFSNELRRLDSPLLGDLEAAMARIKTAEEGAMSGQMTADSLAAQAKQAQVAAESTIIKDFISKALPGSAKSTPTMTLKRLLATDDAANNVTAILTEIKKLPPGERFLSEAALQSSILRAIKDEIFASSPIGFKDMDTAATDAALGKLTAITGERASGMLKALDAAFPDNPFMGETMRLTLGGMSSNNIASRMRLARSGSDTAVNLGIRDSTSTGLLFAFGYMNPTAAAARRISAGQIEQMEKLSKDTQQKILGEILSAPQEFSRVARAVAKNEDPTVISQLIKLFRDAALLNLRYETRVGPEGDTNEQTDSMLGGLVNTVGRGVDAVVDLF